MMLQRAAGIEFTAVPYRGGAPLLTDMLAGVIPVSFNVLGEVLPHVRSGKLRSLAVTSAQRSPFLPDVPTFVEQGFKDIALQEWLGWFLPARTPSGHRAAAERSACAKACSRPSWSRAWPRARLQPRYTTPEEFARIVKQDFDRWAPIVQSHRLHRRRLSEAKLT